MDTKEIESYIETTINSDNTEVTKVALRHYMGIAIEWALTKSKEGAERAGKFAIWLNENRWFNYENGKWRYTFEQATCISDESYEKNYSKTHAELYGLFLDELAAFGKEGEG